MTQMEVSMKWIFAILTATILLLPGCNMMSPRLDEDIDNQNGKIEELKNNQNGILAEIGKLRQDAQVNAKKLDNFQQGLVNLNAKLSSNENSGVQILQGDGALMMVFGLGTIFLVMTFYYRNRSKKNEEAAEALAEALVSQNDIDLENRAFSSAINRKAEKEVYHLICKNQSKMGIVRVDLSNGQGMYYAE